MDKRLDNRHARARQVGRPTVLTSGMVVSNIQHAGHQITHNFRYVFDYCKIMLIPRGDLNLDRANC